MSKLKSIDLFAGIGGIRLGFDKAFKKDIETVFVSEWDEFAQKTYKANFEDSFEIAGDITKIDEKEIPAFDICLAGFPCQAFSLAGHRMGFDDNYKGLCRGTLFMDVARICEYHKPKVIFCENVKGLVIHDKGRTFNIIHNELAFRDYYIRYIIADACDYGIPQHRTRTYIVAFKSQEACFNFKFPDKVNLKKRIFDVIDKAARVDDSFYAKPDSYQFRKLSEFIRDDGQIYRFSDYGIQSSKDGISFTLKANMGTWRERIPYIKDNYGIRKITPYECLALQGFSQEYRFPKIPISSAYKQCGNSVVVPVIKRIAEIIKTLI